MKLIALQIWCAVGIDLTGGQTKDGGSMVGSSVFYNPASPPESDVASDPSSSSNPDAVQSLAAELAESLQEREDAEMWERRLSSLVWIISSATGSFLNFNHFFNFLNIILINLMNFIFCYFNEF